MGTFAFCKYDDATLDSLREWVVDREIPNRSRMSKIHTTIIWSRVDIPEHKWIQRDVGDLRKHSWPSIGFDVFDSFSKRDQIFKKCLVMKLNAPYLHHCHDMLIAAGGSYDHPNYVPHITLSYDIPHDFDLNIPLPKFEFKPSKIFTESFQP